ncbi:MAG: alpha/beta fold hydrolase [Patescibacteria group bacterium]
MFTLVFLHGWGHSRAQWEKMAEMFSPAYKTVIYELPGFGNEPALGEAWDVPEYAAWVKSRVEKDGLTDVILVGHSFGGRISSLIASGCPPWLKGLVLYGAPCLYRPSIKIQLKNFLGHWGGKLPFPESFRKKIRGIEENDATQTGLRAIWRNIVAFDATAQMPRIAVPTLLVWGELDIEAPVRIARELETLIPHATLTVIPNGGHSVHLEQPILFYGILKRFFESLT